MSLDPPVNRLPPTADQIAIQGDKIKIGNKLFRVRMGDEVITQQEMLDRVRKLLEKHYTKESFDSAFAKLNVQGVATEGFKIALTNEGAKVYRVDPAEPRSVALPSGQAVEVDCKPHVKVKGSVRNDTKNVFSEKLSRVQRELTDHINFVTKLQTELASKGYTQEQVASAINQIFEEGHLSLYGFLEGKLPSAWGEKTLSDILHEPGNEGLRAALSSMRATFKPQSPRADAKGEECVKQIQLFILKHMQRNPKSIILENKDSIRQQFVKGQRGLAEKIRRGDEIGAKDIGDRARGWPSEQDKGDFRNEILANNTNLGTIVHQRQNGEKERVVVMRSGKSDTLDRLQENALEACLQQLGCKEPDGLKALGQNRYEFQHTITSYLDPSKIKAMGPDNERRFLHQILSELDKWPEEGIQVKVKRESGEVITVILKKPILSNQLFSTTVRGVGMESIKLNSMGQGHSDRINFIANHQFLERFAQDQDTSSLKTATEALEAVIKQQLGIQGELVKVNGLIDMGHLSAMKVIDKSDIFTSQAFVNYQRAVGEFLLAALRKNEKNYAAMGLFALIFRKDPPQKVDTYVFDPVLKASLELHVADLEIWRNIVLQELKLSSCKQCKSGTDRTAIGVALAVAQEHFRQHFKGAYFLPERGGALEILTFKKYFREALKELGVSMVTETKGYSGLKWGGGVPILGGKGNPVAYKYLYLEEDLEHLAKLTIHLAQKTADVTKLTYKDLQEKAIAQYKGELADPSGVYSKSSSAHIKEMEKLRKAVTESDRQAVVKSMNEYCIKELGLAEFDGKSLFNDQMQLAVHVRKLHLGRPISQTNEKWRIHAIEEKIELLKATQNRTTQQNLQLYMLSQIQILWMQRQESKKIIAFKAVEALFTPSSSPDARLANGVILEE